MTLPTPLAQPHHRISVHHGFHHGFHLAVLPLFFVAAFSTALFFPLQSAGAASKAEEVNADLTRMGQWMGRFDSAYDAALSIIDPAEEASDLFDSVTLDEVSLEAAADQLKDLERALEHQMTAAQEAIAATDPVPTLATMQEKQVLLDNNRVFLDDIYNMSARASEETLTLLKEWLEEEDQDRAAELYDAMTARSFEHSIIQITGENQLLRNQLAATEDSHPQYHIGRSGIISNESFIAVFRGLMALVLGDADEDAFMKDMEVLSANRKATDKAMKDVDRTAKKNLRTFRKAKPQNEAEEKLIAAVITMFETYEESITVEKDIAKEMARFGDIMAKGFKDENFDIEPDLDLWGARIDALVARRLELQNERVAVTQSLQ